MSLKSLYPFYEYNYLIYDQIKFIHKLKYSDFDLDENKVKALKFYTRPRGLV